MRRAVRKVDGPDGLRWTVKRLVLPLGMRPMSRTDLLETATPRRTIVDGVPGRVPDADGAWTGPLPLGFLLIPIVLPFLPAVLLLRWLRWLPWTVEARTYPWGRRFPPMVLSYEIRGHREALKALEQVAAGLVRGDGAPVVGGAELIPEQPTVHGARGSRPAQVARAGRLYGGRH